MLDIDGTCVSSDSAIIGVIRTTAEVLHEATARHPRRDTAGSGTAGADRAGGGRDGRRGHGLVVPTDRGLVQGKPAEGIDQWLGIPYAAPPVGALRWAAPRPAPRWPGIRQATSYGGRCAQLASGNGPRVDNEDCLYLNVYAPPGHDRGLPVLVMIHGGGLTTGAGDQHDGSLIVNTDHIVVVSINYRLGPFGFLNLPGLGRSALTGSGNFGLLDQESALRWVQRNIAAFGGDPRAVTIDGESAGGWSMCALMTSPPARGLFRSAIMQSGSCATQTRSAAQTASLAFAKQAGCPDAATAAACLRGLPEQTLLDASASYQPLFISGGPELPVPAAQAVASGQYNRVPLLIGTNHNEGRTFAQGFTALTQQQADATIAQEFGSRALAILARYPWGSYPSPYTAAYMIGDIWTDSGFLDRDRRLPGAEPDRAVRRHHADVLLSVRRPARARAQQRPPGLPVGRRARHGAGLPVAQLQQRLLPVRPAHAGPARAVPADGQVLGPLHRPHRPRGPWPAAVAAVHEQ